MNYLFHKKDNLFSSNNYSQNNLLFKNNYEKENFICGVSSLTNHSNIFLKPWFHLRIQYNTNMGENVKIIGSIEELGNWNILKAIKMNWSEGNFWNLDIKLPTSFQYKYIITNDNNENYIRWEERENRIINLELKNEDLPFIFLEDQWEN